MAVLQLNNKGDFVIQGLGFTRIPTYITRRKNHEAWEFRFNGEIFSFIDWEYGDCIESLRAAVTAFEDRVEHPMQKPARLRLKESSSKQKLTGTSGVYYYATRKEQGYKVLDIEGKTQLVKIHGAGKFAKEAALQVAEILRQEFVSAYRRMYAFDLDALKEKLDLS